MLGWLDAFIRQHAFVLVLLLSFLVVLGLAMLNVVLFETFLEYRARRSQMESARTSVEEARK